jgi:hypothetical protein
MEQEVSILVPTDVTDDLAAPVTDGELNLAVRQGASNKSPAWDGITLEFYKIIGTSSRMKC